MIALNDFVDQPIVHGFMRLQVLDTRTIVHNLPNRLAARGRNELTGRFPVVRDLSGLDGNVRSLSSSHGAGLIQENGGVGQGISMSPFALREQHGGSAKGLSEGDGVDRRPDVLHDIGNGEGFGFKADASAVGSGSPARVDVHGDGVGGAFVVKIEQFGNYKLCHGRNEGHANVDNTIMKKKRRKVRWRSDADA